MRKAASPPKDPPPTHLGVSRRTHGTACSDRKAPRSRELRRGSGSGARDGIRTRDPRLGKPMLYQLSYSRVPRSFALEPARRQRRSPRPGAGGGEVKRRPRPRGPPRTRSAARAMSRSRPLASASRAPPDRLTPLSPDPRTDRRARSRCPPRRRGIARRRLVLVRVGEQGHRRVGLGAFSKALSSAETSPISASRWPRAAHRIGAGRDDLLELDRDVRLFEDRVEIARRGAPCGRGRGGLRRRGRGLPGRRGRRSGRAHGEDLRSRELQRRLHRRCGGLELRLAHLELRRGALHVRGRGAHAAARCASNSAASARRLRRRGTPVPHFTSAATAPDSTMAGLPPAARMRWMT